MTTDHTVDRREFLAAGSRLAAGAAVALVASVGARLATAATEQTEKIDLSATFPRYTDFDPKVPVHCVTPKLTGCFHRFFNTSPISPSGRYLAGTRLLSEDRLAAPGEHAEIVLVDLKTGETRVVAETRGFDSQLGAQAQWGATDHELFFNDLDMKEWFGFGVRLDPLSGTRRNLDGPLFEVSQDGRSVAGICLLRSALTQRGYGVVVPEQVLPWNTGAAADDGVPAFMGPLVTGEARDAVLRAQARIAAGGRLLLEASPLDREGFFLSPGAVEVARFERSAAEEEIFGPFIQISRAAGLEDAIAQANATNFGLAASLFSADRAEWDAFFAGVRAGCINWNTGTAGASSKLPFGGLGRSGNHRPAGAFAVDAVAYPVATMVDTAELAIPQGMLADDRLFTKS